DFHVTGVQTCALPILKEGKGRCAAVEAVVPHLWHRLSSSPSLEGQKKSISLPARRSASSNGWVMPACCAKPRRWRSSRRKSFRRSEERRVGKECRSWR